MNKNSITPGAKSKVKSSVQRAIRTKIVETYPLLAPHIDEIIPKKSQLDLVKLPDRITLYTHDTTPLFWQHMDDPLIPHLRIVHAFPHCFRRIRIDRGAIRFVLSGATLMAPGLTSAGGRLPRPKTKAQAEAEGAKANVKSEAVGTDAGAEAEGEGGAEEGQDREWEEEGEIQEGEVCIVEAEGKREACMVGRLRMGTETVRKVGKGVVMDGGHYLGDGLWGLRVE